MPALADGLSTLDNRLYPRKEDLPDTLSPGTYVAVDVLFFSTTVIQLLSDGAAYIHVPDDRADGHAFKDQYPDALIGGEGNSNHEPVEGFDFFNSPSYIDEIDPADRPISMTSYNGGTTVNQLRERVAATDAHIEVYVGSTTNARALGHHLRSTPTPVHYVCAGSQGDVAVEDYIGALLIERHRLGHGLTDAETRVYTEMLRQAKGPYDPDDESHRYRDAQIVTEFHRTDVIPRLDGRRLYDLQA